MFHSYCAIVYLVIVELLISFIMELSILNSQDRYERCPFGVSSSVKYDSCQSCDMNSKSIQVAI